MAFERQKSLSEYRRSNISSAYIAVGINERFSSRNRSNLQPDLALSLLSEETAKALSPGQAADTPVTRSARRWETEGGER